MHGNPLNPDHMRNVIWKPVFMNAHDIAKREKDKDEDK